MDGFRHETMIEWNEEILHPLYGAHIHNKPEAINYIDTQHGLWFLPGHLIERTLSIVLEAK